MAHNYRIMVRCPSTGKMIDSGILTSGREAISSGLFQNGLVSCPYCSQMHSFEDNSFLDMDKASAAGGLWRPNR